MQLLKRPNQAMERGEDWNKGVEKLNLPASVRSPTAPPSNCLSERSGLAMVIEATTERIKV